MEVDENMQSSLPEEEEEERQDAVQHVEQQDNMPGSEEIAHEAQQDGWQEGEEQGCAGSEVKDRQADDLSEVPQSAPAALQEEARVVAPTPRKYGRWFQALAVLLALCLVGSVLLLVQPWRHTAGQGRAARPAPTATLPLRITNWCVANGAPVDPQAGKVTLNRVVALASDNVWMLGSTSKDDNGKKNTGRTLPLLEHWNGRAWSIVPTADTSALVRRLSQMIGGGQVSEEISLNDIAVLADRDVWVVGNISVRKIGPAPAFVQVPGAMMLQSVGQPLIEHWDGKTWRIIANPASTNVSSSGTGLFGSSGAMLSSISVVSARDMWAIGTQTALEEPSLSAPPSVRVLASGNEPLVEHWDGTIWSVVRLPGSFHAETSLQVQALSVSDVWVFGVDIQLKFSGTISIGPFNPQPGSTPVISADVVPMTFTSHLIHWNGRTWSKVPLPSGAHKGSQVLDVAAVTEGNLWALGETTNEQGKLSRLETLQRWDGKTWSAVPGALDINAQGAYLDNITVIGLNDIWITGSTGKDQPLMEHWDGQAWSVVVPVSPTHGSVMSLAVAGGRAWALVDEYKVPGVQIAGFSGFTSSATAEVLETGC